MDTYLQMREENCRLKVRGGPTLMVVNSKPKIITIGIQGPQGPPGVDGLDGVGAATYVHVQGVSSATWNVSHGLDKRPSVTVVDSGDTVVVGGVSYIDNNNLTITFSGAFSGKAYIN